MTPFPEKVRAMMGVSFNKGHAEAQVRRDAGMTVPPYIEVRDDDDEDIQGVHVVKLEAKPTLQPYSLHNLLHATSHVYG
jgi:hypothetical protein